ncbi:MAG TPA: DUF1326 domain-containing protein [Candidatus Dormibacteraeota bacterium]|nr:DUF1326 domain-containing protein [Candidatus Dormibacteraeota bacterium]
MTQAPTRVVYSLQGTLLEACSCNVLCPCWIGEDPDGGTCDAFVSYHFDKGEIDGVDVSGLNIVNVAQIPGNVLKGSWRVVIHIDKRATPEQKEALLNAFGGKLGGPLADLAGLIGEIVAVDDVEIAHSVSGGAGSLHVPGVLDAEMEPYRSMSGDVTTLRDSVFSTVPGSPAWVAKTTRHKVTLEKYGMAWEFEGRNAIQSEYTMVYSA